MNLDHSILTLLLLAPLVGAGVLALLPEREGARTHAWGALAVTLITFVLTLHLAFHFNYSAAAGSFQFEQNLPWITLGPSGSGIHYHLGVSIFHANASVVFRDDAVGNREAQPGAAFLGRKMGQEQTLFIFGRDSVTAIGDLNLHGVAFYVHTRCDKQPPNRGTFHRFGGVVD